MSEKDVKTIPSKSDSTLQHLNGETATADKQNTEECQYLNLITHILEAGVTRQDRTGVGNKSVFGAQIRFSLRCGALPLLTTKKLFVRGIIEELLWFIRGSTDARELQRRNVNFWNGNSTREFLDRQGLSHREEGDLGPIYGFQWRYAGAEYVDMHTDYSGQGVDQLAQVIERIRTNPNDRRLLVVAWNAKDVPQMALPPCHCLFQFYVANGELSCQLYQRSADLGLGVPFNIASYALLTHMIAHVTGLKPGDFVHTFGDVHVYLNHEEALRQQLDRTPRKFPTLRFARGGTHLADIGDFTVEDFEIVNYEPHPPIKMEMAV